MRETFIRLKRLTDWPNHHTASRTDKSINELIHNGNGRIYSVVSLCGWILDWCNKKSVCRVDMVMLHVYMIRYLHRGPHHRRPSRRSASETSRASSGSYGTDSSSAIAAGRSSASHRRRRRRRQTLAIALSRRPAIATTSPLLLIAMQVGTCNTDKMHASERQTAERGSKQQQQQTHKTSHMRSSNRDDDKRARDDSKTNGILWMKRLDDIILVVGGNESWGLRMTRFVDWYRNENV